MIERRGKTTGLCEEHGLCPMNALVRVMTSEGRAAIAVVRVWGAAVVEIADAVFRPTRGKPLDRTSRTTASRRSVHGEEVGSDADRKRAPGDPQRDRRPRRRPDRAVRRRLRVAR